MQEKNRIKALSRAKRMYNEIRNSVGVESITEFLSLKWVKVLKESSPKKMESDKLDAKMKNRKERHSEKEVIKEQLADEEV